MDDREYEFLRQRHHDLMRRAQEAIEQARRLRETARMAAQKRRAGGEKTRGDRRPDGSGRNDAPADPVAEDSPAGTAKAGQQG